MKKLIPLGILAAAMSANSHAYQFEAGVNLVTGSGPNVDVDYSGYILGGTAYFEDVAAETGPLAEAAFLQKASGVSLAYGSIDVDGDNVDADIDLTAAELRYVFDNDWLLEVAMDNEDADGDEDDTLGFVAGKYLSDSSAIRGKYAQLDSDDEDADILGIAYKNVMDMEGDAALALEVSLDLIDGDDNSDTELAASATWYLDKNLGVGTVVELLDGDSGDGANLGFDVSYFVSDNLELELTYLSENFEPDGAGTEQNNKTITLGVMGRF